MNTAIPDLFETFWDYTCLALLTVVLIKTLYKQRFFFSFRSRKMLFKMYCKFNQLSTLCVRGEFI